MNASLLIILPVEFNPPVIYISSGVTPTTDDQLFIYYNCYTNDFNDILDFYNNFSTNKNICVVGIFENSNDKKMLFESSNCKIYQNYDINFIFNEIKSTF